MTERQKIIAIGAFAIIVILILLIRNSGNVRNAIINNAGLPGLFLPEMVMPQGSTINIAGRAPFTIPNFGERKAANNLSAIGACCADCGARRPIQSFVPATRGITIVNNEAARAPNIFNFAPTPPPVTPPTRPIYPTMRLGVNANVR